MQLHVFSDASLEAMCIVAYFRAETENGIEVSFVLEKCRIAPIKHLSIPRLELQAALYSVRLRRLIIQEHNFSIKSLTDGFRYCIAMVEFSGQTAECLCCQQSS